MKSLRFLLLTLAIGIVYLAQQVMAYRGLGEIIPDALRRQFPILQQAIAWTPDEQRTVALLAAAGAALLAALLLQPWKPAATHTASRSQSPNLPISTPPIPQSPNHPLPLVLILLALLLSGGIALLLAQDRAETLLMQSGWALSLVIFLVGCGLMGRGDRDRDGGDRDRGDREGGRGRESRPEAGWPRLLLLLIAGGLLFGWQLAGVPLRVDGDPASHGLEAMRILSGQESRIFAPGWANIPLIAYYPSALGMLFTENWVVGNRLAGLYAGLVTLLGIWLLACELFRRPWQFNEQGEVLQDDGRSAALFAVGISAIGYTFIHFSRMPQYMEPVAWGTVGLWALLRGMRTRSSLLMGLSGLLLGLAAMFYYSGRIFALIGGVWWILHWLGQLRDGGGRDAFGWGRFGVWTGGGVIFALPFVGYWLRSPAAFYSRTQEVSIFGRDARIHMEGVYGVEGIPAILWRNLERVGLTFNIYSDTSTHFGYRGPMLDQWVGPLLILGVAALLLNLNRSLSWRLLTWLGMVLLLGGVLTTNAPFWPRLLPALPVIGLICALWVDRLRGTWTVIGGPWLRQFGTTALVGMLILATAHNWIGYYEERTIHADAPTHVGRALRVMADDRHPYLFQVEGQFRPRWDDRIVRYLGALDYRPLIERVIHPAQGWPETVPPGSVFFLLPGDTLLAAELESRYPHGLYRIHRNRLAEPVLILYEVGDR